MKGSDTMTGMNRIVAIGVVFGLGFSFASKCQAQPPIGTGGPPVIGGGVGMGQQPISPYLNLLRGNGSPVINYYGLVRPQMQAQSNFQSLQNQLNPYNAAQNANGYEQPLVTGHPFGFQNSRMYFQNQFIAGGFGAGMSQGMGGRPGGQGVGGQSVGQGAAGQGAGGMRPPTTPQVGGQSPIR